MLEKPSVIEEPKDCPLCGKPAAHRGIVNFCPPEQFACSDSDCQMSKVSCSLEEWNNRPLERLVEEMIYRALIFIKARGLELPGQDACRVHLRRMGWDDA